MKQHLHRTLILLNTGSPLSPSPKDVKGVPIALPDGRAGNIPAQAVAYPTGKGIIVPFRTKGSAKNTKPYGKQGRTAPALT